MLLKFLRKNFCWKIKISNRFNKGGKEAHFQERFATQQRLQQLQEARKRAEMQSNAMHISDDGSPEEKPNVAFRAFMFFAILAAVWSIPCCFYYLCPLESSHAGYVAIK